jgi:tetratricopeptide (TPR) repeat protein
MSEEPTRGLVLRMRHTRRRDVHKVDAVLTLSSATLADARVSFRYELSAADRECLRWYWEDYGDESTVIDPAGAQEVETRLREIGVLLFQRVFGEDDAARRLWKRASARLEDLRVELASGPDDAPATPWELMWDPRGGRPVLGARAFVRATRGVPSVRPSARREGLAVLYVAAPPPDGSAAPFRSVATQLLRSAGTSRGRLEVDGLRSPTFDALRRKLVDAHRAGHPYDVVHFDGDAVTASPDSDERASLVLAGPSGPLHLSGAELGQLLTHTQVRALVLNAAQVLHAEAPAAPDRAPPHVTRRPRALVSVAAQAMDAGVPGVVALPYCAGARALEFCSALYEALVEGRPLGETVGALRRQMHEDYDWLVPVVAFEPAPLRLVETSIPAGVQLARGPDSPEGDFVGRDELILELDRAFVDRRLVLLHGEAGSGKTTTAMAFASWYKSSGGLRVDGGGEGAVLFSVLDEHTTPLRLLDELGETFRSVLESAGVHWMQLDEPYRHEVALQVLRQVPVLWVWDRADSLASDEQRTALRELVRRITEASRARVLVTSRDREDDWLGALPHRMGMTPLPWRDSVTLARAVASREHAERPDDLAQLEPMLRYAAGNPMVISTVVRLALREGVSGREEVAGLLERLEHDRHAGDPLPEHLGAVLRHSLHGGFSPDERARLALLGLFERQVDVDVLVLMGDMASEAGASVPGGAPNRDALEELLHRAAAIGLLDARGGGYYDLHEVISPLLAELFVDTYSDSGLADILRESWVRATASVSAFWYREYRERRTLVIAPLAAEEHNLLRARRLGMQLHLWRDVTSCMNALWLLYRHAGRMPELAPLVDELADALVEPGGDRPQPGLEEEWRFVVGYRVSLARATHDLDRAVELQEEMVAWARRRVEQPDDESRIEELAHAIEDLADLLRDVGREGWLERYEEAYRLFESIAAFGDQARTAYSIATAQLSLEEPVDLDRAADWLRRSLDLMPKGEDVGRARTLAQLGWIAFARGDLAEARDAYERALYEMPGHATSDIAATRAQLGNVYLRSGELDSSLENYREAVAQYERIGDIHGAGLTRYNLAVTLGGEGRLDVAVQYARAALRDLEMSGGADDDVEDARRLVGVLEEMLEPTAG